MSAAAMSDATSPMVEFHPAQPLGPGGLVHEFILGDAQVPAAVSGSMFTVEPGAATPLDEHSVHEVWMVSAGTGELTYDGVAFPLQANQVFYFAPFKSHTVRCLGDERLVIFSTWWSQG